MTCERFVRELRTRIADSWESSELEIPAEMRAHAQQCAACRARLEAARALHGPDPGTVPVPEGLEEAIVRRVRDDDRSVVRFPGEQVAASRRGVRRVLPRGVALAAAAALLVFVTAGITTMVVRGNQPTTVEVHLVLAAPNAQSVHVVGDWNGWDTQAQPLTDSDGDGVWEARFRVEPSTDYEYQFVIDSSRWVNDPNALIQVQDGFGGTNSVLDI
jgi:hypothetical protein